MSPRRRFLLDASAMLIYLIVVYIWALGLHPLGRDYALLAHRGAGMPFIAGGVFNWEIRAFGASPIGYHLVNMALLYACMLCLYRLVRLVVKGYWWLGTLAATLFMANPAHSEAVLYLSGVRDSVPCLLALVALTLYAEYAANPRAWRYGVALAAFALAVLPYAQNAFLVLVLLFLDMFVTRIEIRATSLSGKVRLLPFLAISIVQWVAHSSMFSLQGFSPVRSFFPLYFAFYPIGFLPETVRRFQAWPWLGYLAVAAVVFFIWLIYRKARCPVILFGLFSMAAMRLFQGNDPIDPVHLQGGGLLLLPNALFNIALAALFLRMLDHPKWRRPVVALTTLLCVFFFGLEIQTISAWYNASAVTRSFQTQAAAHETAGTHEAVGILPDYQYFGRAPIQLAESVAYDTPFSKTIRAISLLPLDYRRDVSIALESRSSDSVTVVVKAKNPLDLLYNLKPGNIESEITEIGKDHVRLRITMRGGQLPAVLLPL